MTTTHRNRSEPIRTFAGYGLAVALVTFLFLGCDAKKAETTSSRDSGAVSGDSKDGDSKSTRKSGNSEKAIQAGKQKPTADQPIADQPIADQPAADWLQFRGPDFRSEISSTFPLEWGMDNGIAWKQGLPGRGASSAVIAGDRIFLTAYDGFGLTAEDAGDYRNLRHHLLCLDRETGQPIWHREMTGTSLKQKMNPELARHGFASGTPVTDGENVYVFFGVTGVFAFDQEGTLLWQRNVGLNTHYFGSSSSPVLHGDLLIVNASLESKTIYALNKHTGAAEWMIPNVHECWSMPVIGKNQDGGTEMIVSSKNEVNAYDPETGERLWNCAGILDYVVSVPIIVDGICYLTGGKEKQTMAIRMGGEGDANDRKIWEVKKIGSNVSSPVYKDGRLFIFHDSGVVQIIDARTGELVNRHRTATRERPFASPLLAGQHLYMPFQDAGVAVFTADDECEEVAVNEGDEDLPFMASVVPCGNQIFYRNDQYLYCVGRGGKPTVTAEWAEPADKQLVTTIESFNIDPEKGWSRRYMGFIGPDFDQATRFLLMPYQSVITDEQTTKSQEIILGEKPKYDALRERFEKLQWEELTTPAEESGRFHEQWAALEADTKQLNEETRILVKKLFPDEQLQQHYRDAKEGIAHIKPEDLDKKKRQKKR